MNLPKSKSAMPKPTASPTACRLPSIGRSKGLALASHDDATAAHVDESHALGMEIAEFPTTEEAASLSQSCSV